MTFKKGIFKIKMIFDLLCCAKALCNDKRRKDMFRATSAYSFLWFSCRSFVALCITIAPSSSVTKAPRDYRVFLWLSANKPSSQKAPFMHRTEDGDSTNEIRKRDEWDEKLRPNLSSFEKRHEMHADASSLRKNRQRAGLKVARRLRHVTYQLFSES